MYCLGGHLGLAPADDVIIQDTEIISLCHCQSLIDCLRKPKILLISYQVNWESILIGLIFQFHPGRYAQEIF